MTEVLKHDFVVDSRPVIPASLLVDSFASAGMIEVAGGGH